MEKSAKEEAHTLEQSLRGLLGRTPAGAAAAGSVESLEDHDEDDDDDDEPDIDEATGLESGFGDSFFGIPNVCVEREEIDESTHRNNSKGEDGDDAAAIFGSFHFSSCQQTPISYVCRTKMNSHGIRKTFIVKYQCCYGHQRVEGKPGCVEVHMKPLMDTLEDVGARDFVELVRSSGLDEKVRESNMTIFAPSDDAIRDFTDSFQEANQVEFYSTITQRRKRETNTKEDNLSMRKIVLGHMTPGFYDINEIVNKNEVFTENNNSSIRLNVYPAPGERIITANCARVTSINNYATNGIVHVVDRVLQPVTQSLAQLIAQDEQFTTLESMLSKAGLLKQLAEPGHWTLFAFTDSAFQKLDANIRKRLTDADTCITNVVRHHLVPHTLCSAPIVTHATTLNLDGEPLSLERRPEDGKLFVNKVQIVAKDIMATNGIIHVVDDVLMPDSGQPLSHVLGAHNLTTFRSLLEEAGLSEALDSTSNVTLFVPSEEALSQPEAVAELDKRRGDPAALRDLLLFHSTGPAVKGCDLGSSRHELKSGLADHSLRLGYYSSWPFLSSAAPGRATVECARVTHFDSRACGGVVHEVDRLLVPPENSVLDKLRNLGNYSILLRLIENANLENELKQNAPLTILAPPDSVFEQLDPVDLQLLHNDTQLAARIIKHHILPEMLCCTGIGASSWLFVNRVETLDGHYVAVRRDSDDNVHIGTTTVRQCDIMATDGIIHSVNRIMVPMRRKNSRNKNPNVDVFLYGL
ncbi:Spermatophylax protein 12 [Gryllus bimaculatus]|nr:Spermatophylax protein 12 [Gryllus bimaculatus]